MGAFENYREGTPNPLIVSYPEPEMRTGDFSKLVDRRRRAGHRSTTRSPRPTMPTATSHRASRSPATSFRRTASTRSRWPSPSTCRCRTARLRPVRATPRTTCSCPDYFDKDKFYNLIMKFDCNFGSKDRAFFRHASNDRTEDRAVNGIDNKPGTDGQQPFQRINDAYVVDWTRHRHPDRRRQRRALPTTASSRRASARANAGFDVTQPRRPASPCSAQLPYPDKLYFGRWNFDNGYNVAGPQPEQQLHQHYRIAGQRHQGARARTRSRPAWMSARSTTRCRTPATS